MSPARLTSAYTSGTPGMSRSRSWPLRITRSAPLSRSVTRMSPFRLNAIPQGWESPWAIGTTRIRGTSAVRSTTWLSGGGKAGTPSRRFWADATPPSSASARVSDNSERRFCNGRLMGPSELTYPSVYRIVQTQPRK